MAEDVGKYEPVAHEHDAFLARAMRRKGFASAYAEKAGDYELVRELIAARAGAGLTQLQVAVAMGTTKSAVSRLEGVGGSSPSVNTLRKYARAVGCELEIRFVARQAPAGVGDQPDDAGDEDAALSA